MSKVKGFLVILLVLALIGGLTGCEEPDNSPPSTSSIYKDFPNYPTGMADPINGRLTIGNNIAGNVLLFNGTVEPGNYIGQIGSLGSVKVKLPKQQFYTIVAVQKSNYEERKAQASQFNTFTYYSDTQPYTISVSPSNMWGGGNWVFINNTNYWVQVKSADLGQNYAVIQPNAPRTVVPIQIGDIYQYTLYFSRELKYNGIIIAKVDVTDPSQDRIAQATNANPTFTTTINNVDVSTDLSPSVMVINQSNVEVRVFYSQTQKTNGALSGDFIVLSGDRQIFSGFAAGDSTQNINFRAPSWSASGGGGDRYVPSSQNMTMAKDKIYEITIPQNGEASGITVTEVNVSTYYD